MKRGRQAMRKSQPHSRSKADLGQKEAGLEKTSEEQLRHMEGGKAAEAARKQKAKYQSNSVPRRFGEALTSCGSFNS
jgi:hypothetical protein